MQVWECYRVFLPCEPFYISHVFGKQGHRIKGFTNQVGNCCKIVWDTNNSKFTISASTLDACNHAKALITTHISKISNKQIPLTESNISDHVKQQQKTSIQKFSKSFLCSDKKKRWEIREYLSKKLDDQGNLLFQQTETRSGAHAVPWSAVDAEIRKQTKEKPTETPTNTLTEHTPSTKENKHVDPFEEESTSTSQPIQNSVPDNWEDEIK
jgi:hypothetical protein